jgi:hypothetical protein
VDGELDGLFKVRAVELGDVVEARLGDGLARRGRYGIEVAHDRVDVEAHAEGDVCAAIGGHHEPNAGHEIGDQPGGGRLAVGDDKGAHGAIQRRNGVTSIFAVGRYIKIVANERPIVRIL